MKTQVKSRLCPKNRFKEWESNSDSHVFNLSQLESGDAVCLRCGCSIGNLEHLEFSCSEYKMRKVLE
jgi:hypothetical protein